MYSNIFSVSAGERDVELLLDRVSVAVRKWEKGESPSLDLSMMLGQAARTDERVAQLKRQWNVDLSVIVHSTRPVLGPWIIRFQRLVRKATWWYLEPIFQQVRAFQRNAAHAIGRLARDQKELLSQDEMLERELAALRSRVEVLEARLEEMGDDD